MVKPVDCVVFLETRIVGTSSACHRWQWPGLDQCFSKCDLGIRESENPFHCWHLHRWCRNRSKLNARVCVVGTLMPASAGMCSNSSLPYWLHRRRLLSSAVLWVGSRDLIYADIWVCIFLTFSLCDTIGHLHKAFSFMPQHDACQTKLLSCYRIVFTSTNLPQTLQLIVFIVILNESISTF